MCYINSKCLGYSQIDSVEPQPNYDEDVEESECSTDIIVRKKNYTSYEYSLDGYSVSRFLSSQLVILSILTESDGYLVDSILPYHCKLSSAICDLISINETEGKIVSAIKLATDEAKFSGKSSFVAEDIPLVVSDENNDTNTTITQLRIVHGILYGLYKSLMMRTRITADDDDFCGRNILHGFCIGEGRRNPIISSRCCPNIDYYIIDPIHKDTSTTVPSTTPKITSLTTMVTTKISTSSNIRASLTTAIVVFFCLTLSVLVILGYRQVKKLQNSSPPVNINEDEENLV
ncbi:hypothetical protein [Candidatus Ichthyocystis sparus]|uniref:hypothetical protein n=1 Tax=Candidatus Ichthyocystis sparus TaxID=1561004 RepID=UPI000B85448B|nr:hypothetical protein [Candidatus Ichthyocystis sparus]